MECAVLYLCALTAESNLKMESFTQNATVKTWHIIYQLSQTGLLSLIECLKLCNIQHSWALRKSVNAAEDR